MPDQLLLNEESYTLWRELAEHGPLEITELGRRTSMDPSLAYALILTASQQGYFTLTEKPREELSAAPDAAAQLAGGLAERRALDWLVDRGGAAAMPELVEWAEAIGVAVNEVLRWGSQRGWFARSGKGAEQRVSVTERGRAACGAPEDDERALELVLAAPLYLDELAARRIDPARVKQLLGSRPGLAKIRRRTERTAAITAAGRAALGAARVRKLRNALTPQDIESGAWREIELRPYDVTLASRSVFPAKVHPVRKIIEQIRRTFLEMGFTEVVSPMVESAFWNFDALFQPQDHPARDMQDTFYMAEPARAQLPADAKVEPVRLTHENGWETGSEGWGYRWSPEEARRVVLRTHTTAASIRALAAAPDAPRKFFCVGWTFRNETISFKHLPVFHQVDGIIIDEDASLATLLGLLQEFYRKMGFQGVRFKPSFYPYTEPSADVVVYMESRGKWLEMGGSGIFRPEVTRPLGCRHRVLAWGLGVERLAMLRYGFSDIRELYRGELKALEEVPLCR